MPILDGILVEKYIRFEYFMVHLQQWGPNQINGCGRFTVKFWNNSSICPTLSNTSSQIYKPDKDWFAIEKGTDYHRYLIPLELDVILGAI